jgi:demethylmenaquinone methyltransferase/2-methoxy-6-polyprenyl-1,4-benzoquinol methylase
VEELFDKMSGSYSRVNYISSFGFSESWRKKFVEELNIKQGAIVADLMTGMGECWKFILKREHQIKNFIALDFSTGMINRALKYRNRFADQNIEVVKSNVFDNQIANQSVDYIFSGFGLKTFNDTQLINFAKEVNRILKEKGQFSFIDVSVPHNTFLRTFYMFYLKKVIPIIGKLFLGNPETYRMLGIFTEKYGNSKRVMQIFKDQGFEVEYLEYFYGCASGIKGRKN